MAYMPNIHPPPMRLASEQMGVITRKDIVTFRHTSQMIQEIIFTGAPPHIITAIPNKNSFSRMLPPHIITVLQNWALDQEAPVSITFGRQGSIPLELYNRNPEIESYRLIYKWVRSEGGGGVWSLEGVRTFWDPPSRIFLSHFHEVSNISMDS